MSVQSMGLSAAYSIDSILAVRQASRTQQAVTSNDSASSPSGDTVSISDLGRSLCLARLPEYGILGKLGESADLTDMKQKFQEDLAAINQYLNAAMQAAGVDTSQPMELSCGTDGRITANADHPDKAKIDEIFANDPELANMMRYITGTASFLRAAQEHLEFAREYAKNPEAAVAKYWHLFSDMKSPAVLTLADGELSVAFGGEDWQPA